MDYVITVTAPEKTRIQRVVNRDKIKREIGTGVLAPPAIVHAPRLWIRKRKLDLCGKCNTFFIMKSAAVHSRIDPETKEKAEMILHRLGMTPTEAIRMFYTQITLRNGLPFSVEIPNEETEQALADSRSGRNLERFASADALIDSWK